MENVAHRISRWGIMFRHVFSLSLFQKTDRKNTYMKYSPLAERTTVANATKCLFSLARISTLKTEALFLGRDRLFYGIRLITLQ